MSIPLFPIIRLFVVLLVIGTALCLPLYKFRYRDFVSSILFAKILMWLPIAGVFIATLYLNALGRWGILLSLIGICIYEIYRIRKRNRSLPLWYPALIMIALLHFVLLVVVFGNQFVTLLIVLCIASVMSDVCAFFAGRYLGRHYLPTILNSRKSWEGVAGQIFGAFVGLGLVNLFILSGIPWWLALPVGVGSAAGDLTNSYVKRQVGIKDWSKLLPGHGGFTDRLSSLSGAAMILFYSLLLFGFST
ncbi:MAG: phosphatidate cytidylyltransferase [Candidatus Saccharibacteria bacterium]